MDNSSVMLIVPLGDYSCSVNAGIIILKDAPLQAENDVPTGVSLAC